MVCTLLAQSVAFDKATDGRTDSYNNKKTLTMVQMIVQVWCRWLSRWYGADDCPGIMVQQAPGYAMGAPLCLCLGVLALYSTCVLYSNWLSCIQDPGVDRQGWTFVWVRIWGDRVTHRVPGSNPIVARERECVSVCAHLHMCVCRYMCMCVCVHMHEHVVHVCVWEGERER